jgi:hypothetical protein
MDGVIGGRKLFKSDTNRYLGGHISPSLSLRDMKHQKHAEEFQRNLARFEKDETYQEYSCISSDN